MKLNFPTFTIKVASKPKRETKSVGSNISRKCLAVVKEINGELKAVININKQYIRLKEGDELSNEQLILPFTSKSLNLKDKDYIFLKEKDKYNHYVCIIKTNRIRTNSETSNSYVTLHDNLLIAGHIIRKDNKMYFNYENLIAFHYLSEYHIDDVKIDDKKPLFNK